VEHRAEGGRLWAGLRAEDDIYVESVRKLRVASQWHRSLSLIPIIGQQSVHDPFHEPGVWSRSLLLRFDNGIPQGTFVFFRLLLMESPRVCYLVWMWCGNNNPQITPTNHRETVPAAHDCPVVAHLRYCIFLMSASWSLSTIQTSERKCHRSCLVQLREMVVPTPLLQRSRKKEYND
jgi:hypothetical protein